MEKKSTSATHARPHHRMDRKMVQNVLLIWLDSNIDEKDDDCRNTISQLRRIVNDINTYINAEECLKFIETINDKICIIISGSLGQHIVPRIHRMSQIDSIFIFCGNKQRHEQWAKSWTKIKGVFTDITHICNALKKASRQCEQNATPISFMTTTSQVSNRQSNQLDPMFMYTCIMKEIFLTIKFDRVHFKEFIHYCRTAFAKNEKELRNVEKFNQKYHDETPIWWYSYECFLYPMINRALRTSDVDIIIKMGFFIVDLHRQIETLHKEQFDSHRMEKIFTVYRGQGLSKNDFETLKNTKGGLLSFNNFLSTSRTREVSLGFSRSSLADPDSVGILFVMTIDPSKSTIPFASINNVSHFRSDEDEILFSMHSVFRVNDISPMSENNRVTQVNLTLTCDKDKDFCKLMDYIREETFPDSHGWDRLGVLLLSKMAEPKKAQQVYEVMLGQTTDEIEKGYIYERLGLAKDNQEEFQDAIAYYKKAIDIYTKSLTPNHPQLACPYNNIGKLYYDMSEYTKSLWAHEKALEIRKQSLPPDHSGIAMSYNNIGAVCDSLENYPKALSSYQKALEIQKRLLPSNHPDIGTSYNNIGSSYYHMKDYSKAILYCEKALKIKQQSLPQYHPTLSICYNHIASIYEIIGDYSKASSFFQRAVSIGQRSLPSNHPELQRYQNNLERIKKKL